MLSGNDTISRQGRRRAGTPVAAAMAMATVAGTAVALAAPLGMPVAAAASGGFSLTGSLGTARQQAVAALLANGEVLVAGGADSSGSPIASAELYQPTTGTWQSTSALPIPLSDSTATLLPSGKVLVAGGLTTGSSGNVATAAAELYDPSSGTWTSTGSLPTASYGASAVALSSSGTELYAGGFTGSGSTTSTTGESAVYNPTSGTWSSSAAPLVLGVADASATLLSNGQVLLAGGLSQSSGGSASVTDLTQLYQPTTGTWSAGNRMPLAVALASSATLPDHEVLVAGGETSSGGTPTSSSELYDPTSGAWTVAGGLPQASFAAAASILPSGSVLYAGGMTSAAGAPTTAAATFNPATGQWTTTGSLVTARGYAVTAKLASGSVLVAGGEGASAAVASSELYTEAAPNVAPAITSPATLYVQVGVHTSFEVTSTGSPSPTLSVSGSLPPGLAFIPAPGGTATIVGTPQASKVGSYPVTVVATNGVGNPAVQQLRIIYAYAPRFTSASSLAAKVGVHLSFKVTTSAEPPAHLSESGTLPSGLSFSAAAESSATISGTPAPGSAGTYAVVLVATNGIGNPTAEQLRIVVSGIPVVASSPFGIGYWYVTTSGQLVTKGAATPLPAPAPERPGAVVAIAATPDQRGYYLVSYGGGIFNYGDARFLGSPAHRHQRLAAVAFAVTPSGGGYYVVSRAGGVFGFGSAPGYGSPEPLHVAPTTAFSLTPDGRGYYVVTSAGNVFNYGDARFFGSPAHRHVPAVSAFAVTPDGGGYWVVTVTGEVLPYGDARLYGPAEQGPIAPVTAFAPTRDGHGYWLVTSRGNVFNHGDARFFGSSARTALAGPVSGFAPEF